VFFFYMSSGLFLGWSLGANDAANVFGTAVGSRMIRFRTASVCCCIFLILGAVMGGGGTSHTLGKLGSVNALAGAFVVAFAAALSVYLMILAKWPVSTSQAVVGAIVGWNAFAGNATDFHILTSIVVTWVACPLLSAAFAITTYKLIGRALRFYRVPLFTLDRATRNGLLLAGVFGSYALGANNIANVVGVFLPAAPFRDVVLFGLLPVTAAQQIFFLGGVAISVGVFTYSRQVMEHAGGGIFKMSPMMALVAVWSHSLVLFVFSSQELARFLAAHGLPELPLVPVSSSQAIIGAIIGMGLIKGGKAIRWRVVGGITCGWAITPLLAGVVSFICLFIAQNVFLQTVFL